jgi:predicted amidophosphoribosyltransferase
LKKFRLFLGMNLLVNVKEAILHLAFPHVCAGCGTDSLSSDQPICLRCLDALPQTRFEQHSGNQLKKSFGGACRWHKLQRTIILQRRPSCSGLCTSSNTAAKGN